MAILGRKEGKSFNKRDPLARFFLLRLENCSGFSRVHYGECNIAYVPREMCGFFATSLQK